MATAAQAFPSSTAATPVQTLLLQAGKYVVDGRVSAHDTGADTSVACTLGAGATTIDSMGGALSIDATATIDASVSLHGVVTLTAPTTVSLDCSSPPWFRAATPRGASPLSRSERSTASDRPQKHLNAARMLAAFRRGHVVLIFNSSRSGIVPCRTGQRH